MKKTLPAIALGILCYCSFGQSIPYGNNSATGKYLNVGDAKLYYEVYGTGAPLLLLHGDTFGYIDEFAEYIPLLARHFRVIAVGMRGHGKSEIGTKPYSYKIFAEDAMSIVKNETKDSITIVGFSAGAITAYYLTAYYPEKVKKAVVLGGLLDSSGYRPTALEELEHLTGDDCEKMLPDLVKSRKALMPDPNKYNELINKLRESWLQPVYVDKEKAAAIKCPVLIIGGDRDDYIKTEEFVRIFKIIPNSQLSIIPNCGHVGLILNPAMMTNMVIPFLTDSSKQ
ncbi:MAG TPA: alpha/beta hydrolase [Chryseolinea sp.]|nr:alpha/beta hydrolase [Chryseolinea sp.]